MDIERQSFWNDIDSFEKALWLSVSKLIAKGKEEQALVLLYESLIEQSDNPENCDKFLKHLMNHELSSDVIVHVLNSLSPIRNKLVNWEPFVKYSFDTMGKSYQPDFINKLFEAVTCRATI
jgi:hypothetical protein